MPPVAALAAPLLAGAGAAATAAAPAVLAGAGGALVNKVISDNTARPSAPNTSGQPSYGGTSTGDQQPYALSRYTPEQNNLLNSILGRAQQGPTPYSGNLNVSPTSEQSQARGIVNSWAQAAQNPANRNQAFGWATNALNKGMNTTSQMTGTEQNAQTGLNNFMSSQPGNTQAQGMLNLLAGRSPQTTTSYENTGLNLLNQYANRQTPYGITASNNALQSLFGAGPSQMTSAEQQGQNLLNQYGSQPGLAQNSLWGASQQGILDLLKPKTSQDILNNPEYQAARDLSKVNLDAATTAARSEAQRMGMLRSSPVVGQIGNLNLQSAANLNNVIGNLAQSEANQRMAAMPQAASMAQTLQNEPAQTAQNLLSLGSLPRNLQEQYQTRQQGLIPSALSVSNAQEAMPQNTMNALFNYGQLPRSIDQQNFNNQSSLLNPALSIGTAGDTAALNRIGAGYQYGGLSRDISNQDMARQIGLIPTAMNYSTTEENRPVDIANTLMNTGTQFQNMQTQSDQNAYNEFVRQQNQQNNLYNLGLGSSAFQYQTPQYQPSFLQQVAPYAGYIAGQTAPQWMPTVQNWAGQAGQWAQDQVGNAGNAIQNGWQGFVNSQNPSYSMQPTDRYGLGSYNLSQNPSVYNSTLSW